MTSTLAPNEILAVPLGGLEEARIRIGFGGGELAIREADPGMLLSGTCQGGVLHRSKADGTIELEPITPGRAVIVGHPLHWEVGVSGAIPVDLVIETGGNRSEVDLTALRIRRLEVHTGASETSIRLPAAGRTEVRIACGFASVTLAVPPGVAARVHGKVALGSIKVDETRFPRTLDGWLSPSFEAAADRVDVTIEGGFGSVEVG